jgi:transketolase
MSWHESQRGYFAGSLFEAMEKDDSIYLLVGDLGFGVFDKIRDTFPKRFINCGASEQAMLGIAVGMALEGKKVFVYTITSFFLRAAETISLYLSHENIPVYLVGAGRDDDYKHDGYSHFAFEAQNFIKLLGIESYYPETKEEVPELLTKMLSINNPSFISLKR